MSRQSVFAAIVLCALTADAQDFELDLTTPAVPPALRPSLALVEVRGDEASAGRAALLEVELNRLLTSDERFGVVIEPAAAQERLGASSSEIAACTTYECLTKLSQKLEVLRTAAVVVTKGTDGNLVEIRGLDAALPDLVSARLEISDEDDTARTASKTQSAKDKDFTKRAAAFVFDTLGKLATPNGTLSIDNVDQTALVSIDGEAAGAGSFERIVAHGSHTVSVTGPEYLPFETTTEVAPLATQTVKVALIAKPVVRAPVVRPSAPAYPPLYARPGLYVGAAGVAVAIVGFVFGGMAANTQARAVDANNDGIIDITRQQAKAAQTNAVVANVLVGVGAAIAIGGGVWVALTPPNTPAEGGGFGFRVGGAF